MSKNQWVVLAPEWGPRLSRYFRNRELKRASQRFGSEIGLPDEEIMPFLQWLRSTWTPQQLVQKESPKPSEVAIEWQEHDKPYWHDLERDVYVVHLPSRKSPLVIAGDKWAAIRQAYSNWSGSPASVNELSRKFGMARRTVLELLRCMGTTHDSAPWTEEELHKEGEGVLIDDLLRRKEERVLVAAERASWDRIKADAAKWRNFNLTVIDKLTTAMPKKYTVPKLTLPESNRRFVAVVSPSDFHHGKYSDDYEVNEPDNRELQRQRLLYSTQQVLADVSRHGRPEQIIIGIGSDFFNIDNDQKMTTEGTPQDVDGNPAEILATGCQLMVEYIDTLRQIAPVNAVLMSGNHDRTTGLMLLLYLGAWYRGMADVKVNTMSAAARQYVEYGNNLLCFNHADMVNKTSDLARLAAVERPCEWGRCGHKMVFTGHLHAIKMEEDRGFTRFQLPSLSGKDRWHDRHGYVGNRKQLAAVLVDRHTGVFGTLYADGDEFIPSDVFG